MIIKKVEVNSRKTLVTCIYKVSDEENIQEVRIGQFFKHADTGLAFKVDEINITKNADYTIMSVILSQTGSWTKLVKDSVKAKDLLFEKLIAVIDQVEIKNIEREACYC